MKKNIVMMVDDDTFINELNSMIIKWTPYHSYFHIRENAIKALKELQDWEQSKPENFPDYILLDLKMPEIHGFDFIREFEKSFPERKNKTFFIITTSSILNSDRQNAMNFEGVVDYLIKPIPGDYIEKLITRGHNQIYQNESEFNSGKNQQKL